MTPYLFLLLLNSYHYKVMIWVKKSKQKGAMIIVTSDSLNTFVPGTSLESYACTAQLHFLFYEGNYVSCGFAVSTFCLGS